MSTAKQTKKPVQEQPKAVDQEVVADAYDWGQEQTTGFEATRAEDLGIPFLALLQKGSPEVDEDHADHETKGIEGAEAGMIINTVSRVIVYGKDENEPLIFIPAFHEKLYQEWKARESGGGFVQSHRSAVILTKTSRNEKNQDVLANGNTIITTAYFYGFALIGGEWVRTILPLQSTQLKKARGWLNMMHGIRIGGKMPPMYSHAYRLTTVKESNEKGNWWGIKIEIDHTLTKDDAVVIGESRQIAADCSKSVLALPEAPASASEASDQDDSYAESEGNQRRNR